MYFEQIMTGELFVKIMEYHLLAQAQAFHSDKWFLAIDNDPTHTSKVAKTWGEENTKSIFE